MPTDKKPQKPQVDDAKLFARQSAGQNENFISRKGQMNFAPPFQIRLFKWKVFNLDPNRTHVTKLANKFQVLPNLLLCAFRMQMKCTRLLIGGVEGGGAAKKRGGIYLTPPKENETNWAELEWKPGGIFLWPRAGKYFPRHFNLAPQYA